MVSSLKIQIYDNHQLVFSDEFQEPVELGRQLSPDERCCVKQRELTGWRVPMARLGENAVSRRHVRVESLPDNRIRVTNLSVKNVIGVHNGGTLAAGQTCEMFMPALLSFGDKAIGIEVPSLADAEYQSLVQPARVPCESREAASTLSVAILPALSEQETESLIVWLQTVTDVLHSASRTTDFFQRAAEGVVNLVGLDSCRVLLCNDESWDVAGIKVGKSAAEESRNWQPSSRMLNLMRHEKRTLWRVPEPSIQSLASLANVQAVVAAPILDRHGDVIGAVYGDRLHRAGSAGGPSITKLEAMLVETLAYGVATGLARLDQEQAALAAQVRFEQFFTPELSRQLAAEPDLLKGRDTEVTLLFCDIRGFSRISERLGPAGTVEWIGSVMSCLSDCVSSHSGVLVDYIGDELLAMWGAPSEQPQHAILACRAALDMLHALPELSQRWHERLGEPFRVGIGINTGVARVGNTGSQRKFKYGPLGNSVNLASRIQGATKYLKSELLISASTRSQLDAGFPTRRVGKVRVLNIGEPVELYELGSADNVAWNALRRDYELALNQFEQQDFRQATKILGNVLSEHPSDGPTLVLLSRAVNFLINSNAEFSPEWELPGK